MSSFPKLREKEQINNAIPVPCIKVPIGPSKGSD